MVSEPARCVLCKTGWLATVPPALQEAVLENGRLRKIQAGETFNIAGDTEVGIWGLVSGQVAITSAMNGPDAPAALLNNPGQWGGLAPLFGRPRLANVVARLPSVILFVPYLALRQMLAANPAWWEHFGLLAYEHGLSFGQLAVDLLQSDTRARTAAILLHQAGLRNAGEGPMTLVLTHGEIGAMANLSRHPMANLLHSFNAEGLIKPGYRQIVVLQAATLRRIANGG
jgi:CRP-like cAMP-binding protein